MATWLDGTSTSRTGSALEDGIVSLVSGESFFPENYGALGDGTTDDATAINNCITAAAAVTPPGNVILGAKVYALKAPVEMKRGVKIIGTHYPHWFASAAPKGTTLKAIATFVGDNVVQWRESAIIGGSENSGGAIRGVYIDANAICSRALYLHGQIREGELVNIEATNATGNGIELAPNSSRFQQEILLHRVFAEGNTGIGIRVQSASDLTFSWCGAVANTSHGFSFAGVGQTRVLGCFAEWNQGSGLRIDGNVASDNLRFIAFSTDSNYLDGVFIGDCTGSFPIVFDGLYLNRDGYNLTTYSALSIGTESNYSAPVVINGLQTTVARDDDGTGNYRPITGVTLGAYLDLVWISGGSRIWATTTSLVNSDAASKVHLGKPTLLSTGNTGGTRAWVGSTTAAYTVD